MSKKSQFENFDLGLYEANNEYGIPDIKPLYEFDELTPFVSFNQIKSRKRHELGVHFFIDDYQFNRIWQRPKIYLYMLLECRYVLTPDFSMFLDAPKAVNIFKHYQKQWVGRYLQENGVKVIPTIGWADIDSYDYCFIGVPQNGIIAISSVGTQNNEKSKRIFLNGLHKSIEILKPKKVLFFGEMPTSIKIDVELIRYPNVFYEKFKRLRYGG